MQNRLTQVIAEKLYLKSHTIKIVGVNDYIRHGEDYKRIHFYNGSKLRSFVISAEKYKKLEVV